ncbi:MAG: aminotransferase class V-fold PLP-dependent enzyme [Acidobacteriota bacterium]
MNEKTEAGFTLELSAAQYEELLAAVTTRLVAVVRNIDRQPAWQPESLSTMPLDELPEHGTPLQTVLDRFFEQALPGGRFTTSPRYFAYVPGGGLPQAAAAELLASTVNRFTGIRIAAPGMAAIESSVIAWLKTMIGFPSSGVGALLSGGSLANWSAVIAARERYWPRCEGDFSQARLYLSDQTHDCNHKAARLAGFPEACLRVIPSDRHSRIDLDRLEDAIRSDRAGGYKPFLAIGNAGNVNAGAVDDLEAMGEICARHGLWFHVDAAYGGFFALTAHGARVLRGMPNADSVALDPHKGLFLPFGTGAIVLRDAASLVAAQSIDADYLPGMSTQGDFDPCQLTPELSRPFRALRLWLPISLHGIAAWRQALEEKLVLAQSAHAEIASLTGAEIVAPPDLSLFAWRRGDVDEAGNRELLRRLNASGRMHFSSTTVHGRFFLRLIALNFRTHRAHIEEALSTIRVAWS